MLINKNKFILWACMMCFFQLKISAQDKEIKIVGDSLKLDSVKYLVVKNDTIKKPKKLTLLPFPLLYYSPETSIAGGFFVLFLFKTAPKTRVSNVDVTVVGTSRKQLLLDFYLTLFTKENKFFIKSDIGFAKFPENFYGIGNDQPFTTEKIDYKLLKGNFRILRRLPSGFFIGAQYQFYEVFELVQDQNSPNRNFIGNNGSVSSGAGGVFTYDTRDNVLNPRKGAYFELSTYHYLKAFGSQFVSTQIYLDARKYFKVSKKGIVAAQFMANFNTGDVPFKLMSSLGGPYQMRGYYNGRYRDEIAIILQAEYRHILTQRWGFTVFTSMGDVGKNIADYGSKGMKVAGGAGIRFKLSKKENVNFRLDVAGGIGSKIKPYFNLAEAY